MRIMNWRMWALMRLLTAFRSLVQPSPTFFFLLLLYLLDLDLSSSFPLAYPMCMSFPGETGCLLWRGDEIGSFMDWLKINRLERSSASLDHSKRGAVSC